MSKDVSGEYALKKEWVAKLQQCLHQSYGLYVKAKLEHNFIEFSLNRSEASLFQYPLSTNQSNFSIYPSQSKSFASESRRRSGTPNDAIDSGSLASENWKPAAAKASSMDSNTLNTGLKKDTKHFLSSSLETRATTINFSKINTRNSDQSIIDTYFLISKRAQGGSPANRGLAFLARF